MKKNIVTIYFLLLRPSNAKAGDAIVLTKPLGTQLATNAQIWWGEKGEKYEKLSKSLTELEVFETFQIAIESMTHLNMNGMESLTSLLRNSDQVKVFFLQGPH